jgi:SPP1 family predicted phage head-tail adaptor
MPGKLRHRVELYQRTPSLNAIGEEVKAWTLVGERWAEVVPTGQTEVMVGEEQVVKTTFAITMRTDASVTPDHRLHWDGRVFEISSVVDTGGLGREMILSCVESG